MLFFYQKKSYQCLELQVKFNFRSNIGDYLILESFFKIYSRRIFVEIFFINGWKTLLFVQINTQQLNA